MDTPDGFILRHKDEFFCVLVSPEDFDAVERAGPWRVSRERNADYIKSHAFMYPDGKKTDIRLHRYIAGLAGHRLGRSLEVDHISGDGLDNRRENLRVVTTAQQRQNVCRHDGVSKYRGVFWNARRGKWWAMVARGGVRHYLGHFEDEDEAGRAAAEARTKLMTHAVESRHPVPPASEAPQGGQS